MFSYGRLVISVTRYLSVGAIPGCALCLPDLVLPSRLIASHEKAIPGFKYLRFHRFGTLLICAHRDQRFEHKRPFSWSCASRCWMLRLFNCRYLRVLPPPLGTSEW
jgi:hypothetical protein